MRKCVRCLTPETVDTITFDEAGVCSVCRQIEFKKDKIDWEARGRALHELIAEYKGKGLYDCIVPYSGGKDSVDGTVLAGSGTVATLWSLCLSSFECRHPSRMRSS